MPIGAAVGGAVIGGGASIIGASKAAKAQKQAAQAASDTSLQVAHENNALYRDIYNQNKGLLTPYSDRGLLASNALTDLLLGTHYFNGGQAAPATGGATTQPTAGGSQRLPTGEIATPVRTRPLADTALSPFFETSYGSRLSGGGGALSAQLQAARAARTPTPTPTPAPTPATTPATGTGSTPSALSAWDQFRQGTNYNWRFNEGMRAVTGNYATRGALDSGAAERAKITYGQNFASNELSNYMNLLAGQQAMGLSAAGAVAGVGTSYAGNVAAQNQNAGNAAANAALMSGQASANQWGAIGNGIGQLGGALFQYGMGQLPGANFNPAASTGIQVTQNPNYRIQFPGGF